jgi:multiple sugar transport system permease protein
MSAPLTLVARKPGYSGGLRALLYVFLTTMALAWLVPIGGAIYASFRPYNETKDKGIFSWPDSLGFANYRDAFKQGDMAKTFRRSC